MEDAWIQLYCPECEEVWEENPSDLPAPRRDYQCRSCKTVKPTSEFVRTGRGLDVLESFHR